jgi:hypothetical protein
MSSKERGNEKRMDERVRQGKGRREYLELRENMKSQEGTEKKKIGYVGKD